MRKISRTSGFLLLVSAAAICTGCPLAGKPGQSLATRPAAAAQHTGDGRVYDAAYGFSIVPPKGYVCNGHTPEHFLNFFGPTDGDFTINIVVNASRDDGTPVEQAARRAAKAMALIIAEYALLEEGPATIDGRPSYYSSNVFLWHNRKVRNLQYYIRGGNGRVYILTFAAPAESFDKHRPAFESAAMTVRTD